MFSVPQELLNKRHVRLVCEGVDTVSEIYLQNNHITHNNQLLGTTNNQFIRYVFDVKDKLQVSLS